MGDSPGEAAAAAAAEPWQGQGERRATGGQGLPESWVAEAAGHFAAQGAGEPEKEQGPHRRARGAVCGLLPAHWLDLCAAGAEHVRAPATAVLQLHAGLLPVPLRSAWGGKRLSVGKGGVLARDPGQAVSSSYFLPGQSLHRHGHAMFLSPLGSCHQLPPHRLERRERGPHPAFLRDHGGGVQLRGGDGLHGVCRGAQREPGLVHRPWPHDAAAAAGGNLHQGRRPGGYWPSHGFEVVLQLAGSKSPKLGMRVTTVHGPGAAGRFREWGADVSRSFAHMCVVHYQYVASHIARAESWGLCARHVSRGWPFALLEDQHSQTVNPGACPMSSV